MRYFFNLVISSQAELSPGGSFGQQAQLTAGYGLTRPALRDFFMIIFLFSFFFSARLGIVPGEKHRNTGREKPVQHGCVVGNGKREQDSTRARARGCDAGPNQELAAKTSWKGGEDGV